VLAQRLLRKVCEKCKEVYVPSDQLLKDLGLEDKIGKNIKFSKGKGCKVCSQSGYKGRTGIYELLKVTPEIQEEVLKKVSADEIRAIAVQQAMTTLRQSALEKLLLGVTSPEEVIRVTLESGG
jgi:type II secretory ATPase GspE/PulE/Tfp pilus assembly ATPase PilB-like protein